MGDHEFRSRSAPFRVRAGFWQNKIHREVFRLKNLTTAVLSILVALVIGSPLQTNAANPIPFSKNIIDSSNSGDDKAIADIDKDGKPDGILGGAVAGRSLVWYDSGHNFAMHVIRSNPV